MPKPVRQQFLAGFDAAPPPTPPTSEPPHAANQSKPTDTTTSPASSPAEASSVRASEHADQSDRNDFAGSVAAAPTPGDAVDNPGSLAGKTVYVIDSHSLIYQVFHAMPEMTSPTGLPVAAVHGFVADIANLLEQRRPDYLFAAFDHPGETFRHDLYAEYKEQREEMPDDLRTQIPLIQQLLDALGIPCLSCPQFEADDILATIARLVREGGGSCVLVTADKDCRQLITDQVRLLNVRKNEFFDAQSLQTTWGIRPEQVVDFQTLVGDAVDNIPGAPLIGPKLAADLLGKYQTLDNLLAHAHEVSGQKRRENLLNFKTQAMVSRELVRLRDDAPVTLDWPGARLARARPTLVQSLCTELGFRRLSERLAKLSSANTQVVQEDWKSHYRTVATPEALDQLASTLSQASRISVDTETTSPRPRAAQLVGLSFAWAEGEACYIPVRAPVGEPQLPEALVLEKLRPVLESPSIKKVGQNLKYDVIVLRNVGIELQGLEFDTMVADYLLEPGGRIHNLDDLAKRYLNHTTIKIEELIGTGRHQKRMDEVPVDLITAYAAEDADVPWRLADQLGRMLHEERLESLFHDVEMPLVEVLASLEFHGIRIDADRLRRMSVEYGERLADLEKVIHSLAGHPFNVDSPSQLSEVLFDQLGLPVVKKTKTGKSTDAAVLEELAPLHPLPAKMVEYRQLAKLKSTYLDALPELVLPETGRIHSSFKQDVAATGRLSSTDPNLQNIPVRTDAGREIRAAFLPGPEGWELLTADYSQIELRVLAHFSGDETLRAAFAADEDIHARVASEVQGVPLAEVTRDMRRAAKAINFGVIYGQSAFGLAQSLGISKDEAAQFIAAYFARYPGVDAFMDRTLEQARRQGYVETILGRRRPVQGVRDAAHRGDSRQRNLPERVAINTVIQGSAADLIKLAMIRIHRRLRTGEFRARLLLQIHDELVFELPRDERERLQAFVVDAMANVGDLAVPLKVDVKCGPTWADCEKV
ncbi:MAG: DNA polymerase I [Pirellulales bacterium]